MLETVSALCSHDALEKVDASNPQIPWEEFKDSVSNGWTAYHRTATQTIQNFIFQKRDIKPVKGLFQNFGSLVSKNCFQGFTRNLWRSGSVFQRLHIAKQREEATNTDLFFIDSINYKNKHTVYI